MSNADRIEELRSKYEENPRRYFAPLANEYRKAGDLAQAIAICREHLPKQPGHMSGYIVFGQTLFEADNLTEARSVFEQALTLDPENLIALKHLGDIARMNGETAVARRWYARVLDADPRNDDIALQLASLGAPTPAAPMAAVPAPAPYHEPPLEDAVGVFATFDPSLLNVPDDVAGIAGGNAFWSPPQAQPARIHEPLDLDFPETPEPVADAAFEEGILAPEWPDTSELVARIVTPLRSVTPISVPATPEAVQAFGREASDTIDLAPVDFAADDDLVEPFLSLDTVSVASAGPQVVEATDTPAESVADVVSSESVDVHAESSQTGELVEFETSEFAIVGVDDFALPEAPPELESAGATAEFSEPLSVGTFEDVADPENQSATAEPDQNHVVAADTADAPHASDATDADVFAEAGVQSATGTTTEAIAPSADDAPIADWASEDSVNVTEWAEPVSVPPVEIERLAIAAEWPWESETDVEVSATDLGDTDEYPAPAALGSGVHVALVPEESFADISSELQNEHDASEREETDRTALAHEAAESAAEAEVAAFVQTERAFDATTKSQPFVTETMGELLVSQGFTSRAVEVYEELVSRRPHDPVLALRLTELRALEQSERPFAHRPEDTATPSRNAAVSATPVFVPTLTHAGPESSTVSERQTTERLQAFRTARERFAELAARRVARRTPTHATAVSDDASESLSSLFGTTVPATTDELAARALADAFGPTQDSGESLFDPAPTPAPAIPLRSLTPRSSSVAIPRAPETRGDRQPSADYSFDKFFPDPALSGREGHSAPATTASPQAAAQPVTEDLAQFSAWLKGLNNA